MNKGEANQYLSLLKVDGRDCTKKASDKLYFHCGPLKSKILELLELKLLLRVSKKMENNLY